MKVIIDSGSTKADWRLLTQLGVEHIETVGFSPVLHSAAFIQAALHKAVQTQQEIVSTTKQIYYYGTGCWDEPRKKIIENALQVEFPQAAISVESDLFGAARATCGITSGIVAILGTGSNSCFFNGAKIVHQVANLGYLLGDEGSGGDLGKALLQAYFYKELPEELGQKLAPYFPEGKTTLLDKLYNTERPNAYLASFTTFMAEHQAHPYIQKLIEGSFASFIDRHLTKYPDHQLLPIHFVGSIAFYFQDFIKKLLAERDMQVGRIIKKPIDYLVKFHKNYE